MLGIDNIDVGKQYATEREEIEALKSYMYQLYQELEFRLGELEKKIKEMNDEKQ